ncbi:hypothetical protein BDV39DRAFT_168226 [Aspergillus sergii]|uniref:Methyltransferase domain-containing protein n=1 Tax=Aspergillus sergii TaxID=1034303 RepID=A0A5N6XEE4_9EURO|nr:hypothetical protein BDV39DRAFT_168226 [Aspergillus sergii]
MYTNFMGCDVDMRIGQDGRAYVIEVDPLPVFFYPTGSQLEDTDVKHGFPGGYRAVVNTYITNYFLKHPGDRESRFVELAAIFDRLPTLPSSANEVPELEVLGPWNGTVLDLGCGKGSVGRALHADPRNRITHLIGVDISKQSLDNQENSTYNELIHDRMECFLAKQTSMFDHIFCISALQFLPVEELDFVLARCFQLARCSITIVIDDLQISRRYTPETLAHLKAFFMDHSENIKTFQIQHGWRLQSSTTGHRLQFHLYRDGKLE